MIIYSLIFILFLLTVLMLFVAALSDFCKMQIENYVSIVIVSCFCIAYLLSIFTINDVAIFDAWWIYLLSVLIAFILSFAMFAVGIIGGGDSKLITAIAAWLGLKGLLVFMLYMSIAGGILAFLAVILKKRSFLKPIAHKLGDKSWANSLLEGKNALPYGIAILAGAIGAFIYIDLPQNIINQIYTNN